MVLQEAEDEVVEDQLQRKPWLQRHLPHGRESSEDLLLHFMEALEDIVSLNMVSLVIVVALLAAPAKIFIVAPVAGT